MSDSQLKSKLAPVVSRLMWQDTFAAAAEAAVWLGPFAAVLMVPAAVAPTGPTRVLTGVAAAGWLLEVLAASVRAALRTSGRSERAARLIDAHYQGEDCVLTALTAPAESRMASLSVARGTQLLSQVRPGEAVQLRPARHGFTALGIALFLGLLLAAGLRTPMATIEPPKVVQPIGEIRRRAPLPKLDAATTSASAAEIRETAPAAESAPRGLADRYFREAFERNQ